MAYLLKNNIVFIHVPKTGGTSLVRAFRDDDILVRNIAHEHATYCQAIEFVTVQPRLPTLRFLREALQHRRSINGDTVTFAVVRHPYSYYPSMYHHLVKRREEGVTDWRMATGQDRWHPWEIFTDFDLASFDTFMDRLIESHPGYLAHLYEEYCPRNKITNTLRLESIQEDIRNVPRLAETGFRFNIPHERRGSYEIDWNTKLLEKIYVLDRSVLDRFGYEKL